MGWVLGDIKKLLVKLINFVRSTEMFSSEVSKYHFIFLNSPIKETNKAKC